ncbi:MAG: HAMP domain-containing protein [Desulfobacteraceae bacterium]|nr:HAMP domain-containing protein [Desulfobacteraceae bacterium]
MKIETQCAGCEKRYKLNVKNVSSRHIKFKCQSCQTENTLKNPSYNNRPVGDAAAGSVMGDLSDKISYRSQPQKDIPLYDPDYNQEAGFFSAISIRTKIIAVLVTLVAVSLSIVGLVASSNSRLSLSRQAETFLSLTANQKAEQYSLVFERVKQETESITDYAKTLYERDSGDDKLNVFDQILLPWNGKEYKNQEKLKDELQALQHMAPLLSSMVNNNPFVSIGYIGSASGILVIDNPTTVSGLAKLDGYDCTKRPWYIKAKEEKKTIWSGPYIDADSNLLVVTCASPVILSNGLLAGVVGYDVLLGTIQKDILSLDIGYKSYAFLVNNLGKALVRPGMQEEDTRWDETYKTMNLLHTTNSKFNSIVENMVGGFSGIETYNTSGADRYVAYASLPVIGASVAIVASKNQVVAPAVKLQRIILGVWFVVLVIAIIIGFLVGNGITKPINELTYAAERISKGEIDLELRTANRNDEIGNLTKAFKRMATSLKIAMKVR